MYLLDVFLMSCLLGSDAFSSVSNRPNWTIGNHTSDAHIYDRTYHSHSQRCWYSSLYDGTCVHVTSSLHSSSSINSHFIFVRPLQLAFIFFDAKLIYSFSVYISCCQEVNDMYCFVFGIINLTKTFRAGDK